MKSVSMFLAGATLLLSQMSAFALDVPKPFVTKPKSAAGAPLELKWEDLMPPEERNLPLRPSRRIRPLFDDESGPGALQEGSTAVNRSLNGKLVKIPGFVVPLTATEENAILTTFLLVPYFGACIHVPPPAPNQIVYVEMKKPFRLTSDYAPVWVTGKLATQGATSGLGNSAYSLTGVKIENYEEPP